MGPRGQGRIQGSGRGVLAGSAERGRGVRDGSVRAGVDP